jgi:photosystem II stability/assembly factor-like uncharacterized protein
MLRFIAFILLVTGLSLKAQWTQINTGLANNSGSHYGTCFTSIGDTLLAGTYGGVYTSTDNGNSWIHTSNGLTDQNITALASKGGTLFAGTAGSGVFVSTDKGNSWTLHNIYSGINSFCFIGNAIYAGTSYYLYKSSDNGATWNQLNPGLGISPIMTIASDGTNIFAATSGGGIKMYNESNQTWTARNSGISNPQNLQFISLFATGSELYAGSYNIPVYYSSNGGNNWNPVGPSCSVYSFLMNGSGIVMGSEGGCGVMVTRDHGNSWASLNSGTYTLSVSSLYIFGSDIFAGTIDSGIYKRPLAEISGIAEKVKNPFELSFYPNPFESFICLKADHIEKGKLILFNSQGEKLFEKEITTNATRIDMTGLPKGLYYCQLIADGRILKNEKLLKE